MSSSPSLLDSFLALFQSDKKKAAAKAKAEAAAKIAAAADRVDGIVTPYGIGTILSYEGNEIVRVQLDYAVAFMHLSSLLQPQLLRAPAPIGYVVYNSKTKQFEKQFGWGLAVVSVTGAGVTPIYSFVEQRIAVSTPYGKGILIGHSRPDGIIQVKTEGAVIFTTFDQIKFIDDAQAQAAAAAVEPEQEEAAAAVDADESKEESAPKAKKGKGRK